jgi:hypothetical protein
MHPDLGLGLMERVTRIELALSAWENVPGVLRLSRPCLAD